MQSDAASDGEKRWQQDMKKYLDSLSDDVRESWWRIVRVLHTGEENDDNKAIPLQFELRESRGELKPRDLYTLRTFAEKTNCVILDSGGPFKNMTGETIVDNLEVGRLPAAHVFVSSGRTRFLYQLLKPKSPPQAMPRSKRKRLSRAGLTIDFSGPTLKYKKMIPISLENQPVKMLMMLMESDGIVEYEEFGKKLMLKNYSDGKLNNSFSLRRDVNQIRSELGRILKSAGVEPKKMTSLIVSVRKQGYRMTD